MLLRHYTKKRSSLSLCEIDPSNKIRLIKKYCSNGTNEGTLFSKNIYLTDPVVKKMTFKSSNRSFIASPTSKSRTKIYVPIKKPDFLRSMSDPDFVEQFYKNLIISSEIIEFHHGNNRKNHINSKTEALRNILLLVEDIKSIEKMPYENICRVFDMCMFNIMRSFPEDNPSFFLLEEVPLAKESSWEHIEICYKILLCLIKFCPNLSYFSIHFIRNLFLISGTPDDDERAYIVQIIRVWLEYNHNSHGVFIQMCNWIIHQHCEGDIKPFHIRTIINIFVVGFKSLYKGPKSGAFSHIIRTSVFPLLSDKYSVFFYQVLADFILSYLNINKNDSLSLINRIMMYWPHSKTTSQTICIVLLAEAAKNLHKDHLCMVVRRIILIISSCLESYNSRVIESTGNSILSNEFSSILKLDIECVKSCLLPIARKTSKEHWSEKARAISENIASNLEMLIKDNPNLIKDNGKSKKSGITWNDLL